MKSAGKKTAELCEYGGEGWRAQRVRVYRYRRKRHVLFQGMPALVCPACGHRLFDAATVEAMEHQRDTPTAGKCRAELTIESA